MNTKTKALYEAQRLLLKVGFHGFSFQHLADALQIRKPSLYDHFESKEALGAALIEEFHGTFDEWTKTVADFSPREQVGALFEIFCRFIGSDGKVCPLTAMLGDFHSLPKSMKKSLTRLTDSRRQWLREVIAKGQQRGEFRRDQPPAALAELVLSIGLGAQLLARVSNNPELVRDLKRQVLAGIVSKEAV